MTHHETVPEGDGEAQRQRDLVVQVRRFLKYAPRGTDAEVLRREAKDFDERLRALERGVHLAVARKLRGDLRRIHGGAP